jgi:ubiquinone/menaquinone biosynthesis C-methylase UbiE
MAGVVFPVAPLYASRAFYSMNLFAPSRHFDPDKPELLDRPGVDPALLREELQLLENANAHFGGHQLALHYVKKFFDAAGLRSASILDLATGRGDIPRAIVRWARPAGLRVNIVAVDGNPVAVESAREACRDYAEIQIEQHDLRSLPYGENSFDLVMCSLALHHFSSADALEIFQRIYQMARNGYLVNDPRRNWLALWTAQIFAPIMIKSFIFRHDAIESVRAAFTIPELREMATRAGMKHFQIRRHQLFFRMVLAGKK